MRHVDEPAAQEVDPVLPGDFAHLFLRADEDRAQEARFRGGDRALQRLRMDRLREHRRGGGQPGRAREELLVARPAIRDGDLGQFHALALYFLGGRQNFRLAGDHLQSILVGALAVEDDVLVVVEFLLARDLDGDGVADLYRAREAQRLADVDRARPGKLGAEHRGDERAAPHAVRDDLVEHGGVRVLGIHMRRVDVARHDGEELDVLRLERPGEDGALAELDLVVSAVLDELRGHGDGMLSVVLALVASRRRPLWIPTKC